MSGDDGLRCRACGARMCQQLFDRLLALEFEQPDPYGRLHAITVPAWFLQHPDRAAERTRPDHWAILQRWRRDGLAGVDHLVRQRRVANRRGGDLPPAMDASTPPVSDRVSTTVTIADVAGPGRDFPAAGHAERVAEWVRVIASS